MKNNHIFVLEFSGYRGDMCQDVGLWSHASHDLKELEKFLELLLWANEGLHIIPIDLKISRYSLFGRTKKLFQYTGMIHQSAMDRRDNFHPKNNFFNLSQSILRMSYCKKNFKKESESYKKEFKAFWHEIQKKLKEPGVFIHL
jgi:hypothetical protein